MEQLTRGMLDVLRAMYNGATAIQWASDKVYLKTAQTQWEVPYVVSLRLFPVSPWIRRTSYGMVSEHFELSEEGKQAVEQMLCHWIKWPAS